MPASKTVCHRGRCNCVTLSDRNATDMIIIQFSLQRNVYLGGNFITKRQESKPITHAQSTGVHTHIRTVHTLNSRMQKTTLIRSKNRLANCGLFQNRSNLTN